MKKKITNTLTKIKFNTIANFFQWIIKEREIFPVSEKRERNLLSIYVEKFLFLLPEFEDLLF